MKVNGLFKSITQILSKGGGRDYIDIKADLTAKKNYLKLYKIVRAIYPLRR